MKKDGKRWKKMEGKSVHQRIENGLSLPLSLSLSLSLFSLFLLFVLFVENITRTSVDLERPFE
jgi:hypothetical protein